MSKNLHHVLVAIQTEREIDTMTMLKMVEQRIHTIQHVARTAAMQGGVITLELMKHEGLNIFEVLEDEAFGHTAHRRPEQADPLYVDPIKDLSAGAIPTNSWLRDDHDQIASIMQHRSMASAQKAAAIMAIEGNKQLKAYDSVAAYYENTCTPMSWREKHLRITEDGADIAKAMFDEWTATSLSRVASALGLSIEDLKRDIPFVEYKATYRSIFGEDPVPNAMRRSLRRQSLRKVIREAKKLLNIENRVLQSLHKDREREALAAERAGRAAEAQQKATTAGQGAQKRDTRYRDHALNLLMWIKNHYGVVQCRELFQTPGIVKVMDFLNANTEDELLGHIDRFETFIMTNTPTEQRLLLNARDPLPAFITVFPKFDPRRIVMHNEKRYFISTTPRYKLGGVYDFKATADDKSSTYCFRATVVQALVPAEAVILPDQRKNHYILQADLTFMSMGPIKITVVEDRLELA